MNPSGQRAAGEEPGWVLPTASGRYLIGFTDLGGPFLASWGPDRTPIRAAAGGPGHFRTAADMPSAEFSALGTRQVRTADLVCDQGDGLLGARLVWSQASARVVEHGPLSRFAAEATEPNGRLGVRLEIETSREHDVVTKRVVITNTGADELALRRAFGPAWELPLGPGVEVDVLAGDWSREFTPFHLSVPVGEYSIGSRQGITGHRYSPVITVSAPAAAADAEREPAGCFGLALAWSGSWRLSVEAEPFAERVRIAGGVDDESAVITLQPGETFRSPDSLGVQAPDRDRVTERWHDHQRRVLSRDIGLRHRPIVYNSWYATSFDVEVDHQIALADVAAELGCEVFVVDDGWFSGRRDDRAGLGDWRPDATKFPDGLAPLARAVQERGMRFGLWVEPEAVNPDSDLYRAHPDWVYRAGDRPLSEVRHQYVLDFGRPEVVTWTLGWLRDLLTSVPISYLKWDMNRPVSDGNRPGDPHGRQWSVQHVEGYHRVLEMLREEFPAVTVEACSGGGGRIDAAVLARTDVVWTSDETGARDRLAVQHGFLSAYGPHLMSSWVTDEPSRLDLEPVSFEFGFVVAMAGVLGIGSDLLAWSAQQRRRAAELIELYRRIRDTVHRGTVRRHRQPADPVHWIEYATPEQIVILVWARSARPAEAVITAALAETSARYRVRGDGQIHAGAELAAGLAVPFTLAADTDVVIIDRIG